MSDADFHSDRPLPDYLQPYDRHMRRRDEGMHPCIEFGDSYRDIVGYQQYYDQTFRHVVSGGEIHVKQSTNPGRHGWIFHRSDGDRLIGFLKRNQCPVCGQRGSLIIENYPGGGTFVRGVETRRTYEKDDGKTGFENNDTVDRLEENGWHVIKCSASADREDRMDVNHDFYVGLASEGAYTDYDEWLSRRQERGGVRTNANRIIGLGWSGDASDPRFSHGDQLAAIYELLGAEDYDERDLIDRGNVTKDQLATIINRLKAMDLSERQDWDTERWLAHRERGINQGNVQWHIPEWADADDLFYGEGFKRDLWE